MTLTIPDLPGTSGMTEADLRLELACALYAQGKLTKLSAAEMAGTDLSTFQAALGKRNIESYPIEMLESELEHLRDVFPA
jgi:predicted HTH domain antitoxin